MTLTNELLEPTQVIKQKFSTVQTIDVIECCRWHCSQPCESRQVLQVYRIKNQLAGATYIVFTL